MELKMKFTRKMRQVSGFGGSYERTCRKLILDGIKWIQEHPDKNPVVKEFPQIFGITDNNTDAEEMIEFITQGKDCTGARCFESHFMDSKEWMG
jgi:hypothetical protein